MLCEGEGTQGSVKGAASGGDEGLLHEEVEVHFPNARHLVEQHEGALEQGVDLDIMRRVFGGIFLLEVLCAELEVELPELVGARQGGACTLEDEGLLQEAAARLLEAVVVQPGLDAARVALDVLLVDDVLVGDEEKVVGALHLAFAGPREARRHGAKKFARHCDARTGVGQPAVGRDAMGVVIDGDGSVGEHWSRRAKF